MSCCLCGPAHGKDALLIMDLLSPNMQLVEDAGTPKHLNEFPRSVICLTQVLPATNSALKVAVSVVACFLECHMIGVLFARCTQPVTDFPDSASCIRFTLKQCAAETTTQVKFQRP